MKGHNNKICVNYLAIYYQLVLDKLKDKYVTITIYQKFMKEQLDELKYIKVQLYIYSICKRATFLDCNDAKVKNLYKTICK